MNSSIVYKIADDAVIPLLDFCDQRAMTRFFLVADSNTYQVLGQRVEHSLQSSGIDVKTILLSGESVHTDAHSILQTLVAANGEDRPYIAVGSGTITDITRFVSHRTREPFISLPTAPSVDGYTSIVAPTVVGNYKFPLPAQPPIAVFADLPTLCAAPKALIAAGLGDLLGKLTSLVDWRIGALLYDEPYNAEIAQQMRASVERTVVVIDSIAAAQCEGITRLMDGLIGAGFGMLAFGESRPASGSEHHLCHYWEMKRILEDRPAILHGADVGIGTILSARRYEVLRAITRAQASTRLQQRTLPTQQEMIGEIRAGYGAAAEQIIEIQAPLLNMNESDLERLKTRILSHWDDIQAAAALVPPAKQIERWLSAAGGPTHPSEIGLSPDETQLGLVSAHYLRDRFTLNRLGYWLNLPFEEAK